MEAQWPDAYGDFQNLGFVVFEKIVLVMGSPFRVMYDAGRHLTFLSTYEGRIQVADYYKVKLKVVSQKGTCVIGHKVGDEFVTSGATPKGICLVALNSMFPTIYTFMFGGSFPWSKDPDIETPACPDAENPTVFEVQRIRSEE